jgi:hypothetical protein
MGFVTGRAVRYAWNYGITNENSGGARIEHQF